MDFKQVQKKLRETERAYDRAKGTLDTLRKRLKDEFGADTIKDGKAKLKELQKKINDVQRQYDEAEAAFDEKWSEQISQLDETES